MPGNPLRLANIDRATSYLSSCAGVLLDKRELSVFRLGHNRFTSACHGGCGCDNRTWA